MMHRKIKVALEPPPARGPAVASEDWVRDSEGKKGPDRDASGRGRAGGPVDEVDGG